MESTTSRKFRPDWPLTTDDDEEPVLPLEVNFDSKEGGGLLGVVSRQALLLSPWLSYVDLVLVP